MITSGHNYSEHEHLVLTRHKSYTTIHARSCQPDTERQCIVSCVLGCSILSVLTEISLYE